MTRDAWLTAAFVLAASFATGRQTAARADDPAARPGRVVVVELFTSQGCSSCPPADRLLRELGERGVGKLVPLAYHVDYWNHIGWTDPFSNADWSKRQQAYARRLDVGSLYTPQAVVDGAAELVGSDAGGLRAAIAAAAAKPAASIALRVEPRDAKLRIEASVELPGSLRGRTWDLMVALYETGLSTTVGRGENGGRTLQNDYVVRSLRRAGRVKASTKEEATVNIESGWNRAHLGVAAFLQDPDTLEIRGASARAVPAS